MSSQISAEKQIVLVVGGSQGIGLGLVERALNGTGASWINKDALVIATGRDPTTAEELLKLQSEYKDRLYLEAVDVSSPESITAFVTTINAKYPRLDVLLYNAGVLLDSYSQDYAKLDQDVYIKTHIINVIGPQHIFFGLSNLLNKTHELLGGTVGQKPLPLADDETKDDVTKVRAIFVSSVLGTIDFHQQYLAPIYSTSKAALNHIIRDIAIKFPHLGTFLVHPGYVKTRLTHGLGDITVSESSQGIYDILDKEAFAVNSTKHLLSYDGSHPAW